MNIIRRLAKQSGMSVIDDEDVYCTLEHLEKFFDLVLEVKNKEDRTSHPTTFALRPPLTNTGVRDVYRSVTIQQ